MQLYEHDEPFAIFDVKTTAMIRLKAARRSLELSVWQPYQSPSWRVQYAPVCVARQRSLKPDGQAESELKQKAIDKQALTQFAEAAMITNEVHGTPFSDKNNMTGKPEVDEDARTVSSEGSYRQAQWITDTAESEDEFVDAMEPPSSTSGVLLTFECAAPPLSGVYEDAVEATDEQILAALTGSDKGSDRMQSTIQEDEEVTNATEKVGAMETEVEGEIVAIVERLVESTVSTEEDVESYFEEVSLHVEDVQGKNSTKAPDEAAQAVAVADDQSLTESAEDTGDDVAVTDAAEIDGIATEEKATGEIEEIGLAKVSSPIESEDAPQAADRGNDAVRSSNKNAVIDDEPEWTRVEMSAELDDAIEEHQEVATAQDNVSPELETTPEDSISDQVATDAFTSDLLAHENNDIPVECVDWVTHAVQDEHAVIKEAILHEDDDTKEVMMEEIVEAETVAADSEDTEEEQPNAAGPAANTEVIMARAFHKTSAKQEEATLSPENASQVEQEATVSGIEEIVDQVTNELVEAVQLEQEADLEEKTVPNSDVEATAEDAETGELCNDDNDHVVVDFMPRFGPSSGMTTTTTIEPFVLSSESNEMIEAHFPLQRWTYELYGFSIRNRVVFYHIHRSDHRTGIRQPPVLKRYTDFRELQTQLLDTRLHAAVDMPRIPRPHLGTVFRSFKSKKTIEMRESAFRALLRYIAQYPELHGSAVFEQFIATSRNATGAGWM